MIIEKVGPNHVLVKEIITIKDINGKDVEIFSEIKEYGQDRIDKELAKIEKLEAKKSQLLEIQAEMAKE